MSDTMFYGVLRRMPYEMAMSDDLSRLQFYERAQEAADRVEAADRIAELEARAPAAPTDAKPAQCQAKLGEWSECQMRTIEAYNALQPPRQAAQSVRDALEQAAKIAITLTKVPGDLMGAPNDAMRRVAEAGVRIESAIRALIQSPQAPGKEA